MRAALLASLMTVCGRWSEPLPHEVNAAANDLRSGLRLLAFTTYGIHAQAYYPAQAGLVALRINERTATLVSVLSELMLSSGGQGGGSVAYPDMITTEAVWIHPPRRLALELGPAPRHWRLDDGVERLANGVVASDGIEFTLLGDMTTATLVGDAGYRPDPGGNAPYMNVTEEYGARPLNHQSTTTWATNRIPITVIEFEENGVRHHAVLTWQPSLAGRAEVTLSGARVGTATECWSPALIPVYYSDSVGLRTPFGSPEACLTYQ